MKKLLLSLFATLSIVSANAQFNYTFSKHTSLPYVPLTAGTGVNGNLIWDDENFQVPIGFTFDMDGISTSSIGIVEMRGFYTDTMGTVNGFSPIFADLVDRNLDTGTVVSFSPIRYELTGTTPNRICKIEVFNAGFFDEWDLYSTINDSVNFQVWFYETSNIVEFRFGESYINHQDEYFFNDSGVVNMGYMKQFNTSTYLPDMFYYVLGDTSAPTIDSTGNLMNPVNEGLNAWPSSGTVYRFTPSQTTGVKNAMAALKQVTVYPTNCAEELFVDNSSNETIHYNIFSATGAKVNVTGNALNGKNKIDISTLPAGMYLLQLSSDKVARSVKFIKQ